MNNPLRVAFFGTPSFVLPIAQVLKDSFNLVAVVSTPDTVQGRKKTITASPVKQFAEENRIPVFTPEQLRNEIRKHLQSLHIDLVVVAAYGLIIPQQILDLPLYGCLNIHPSLLPKYRGASPIQSALLEGDTISGVTVIKMDADVDHGPVIHQWQTAFRPNDTFQTLHVSLFIDAANRLPKIITNYTTGKIIPVSQDDSQATFCERITRESGYFDFENPPTPVQLDRMIRAYYPWPNAWTRINVHGKSQVLKFFPNKKIQIEGKNVVEIKEFLNGYPELREKIYQLLGDH